jgi:hypothetical protein
MTVGGAKTAADILREHRVVTKLLAPGRYYSTCPQCSHKRRKAHQRLECLGVTIGVEGVKFGCNHCGWTGGEYYARTTGPRVTTVASLRQNAEFEERQRAETEARRAKALALWRTRQPLRRSLAETYLREARAYHGAFPPTLGFLPPRGKHPPAMIAAFGIPLEPEPGRIDLPYERIAGVHLTRLAHDGRDRDRGEKAKIMIGFSTGSPIVVSPPTDGAGLVITEGIEDALSAYEATGLYSWAAGCASRMPALATTVPNWAETVTILADDDRDGRRHAVTLAEAIKKRGIEVRLRVFRQSRASAA